MNRRAARFHSNLGRLAQRRSLDTFGARRPASVVREALASRPSTDAGGRASLCVFFGDGVVRRRGAVAQGLRPRRGWRRGRARPGEGRGAAERRGRGRRAFMWRFGRANRIWLQALQICSPPRRAPHACEFVHGWSTAARAAHFETLAAYGRLYLIARARHSSGASTGRPDPLLSPSRRRRGVGAASWARHSL